MPKVLLNPFRNNLSIQGLTLRHDELLDQPVLTTSNVTFNSLKVGNLEANGNIYFTGNITEVETTHLVIRDNIIDINRENEVPLLKGGFSIYRGSGLPPFNIIYDEPSQLLRIGFGDDALQAVATRQDNPQDGDVAVWNTEANRFDVKNRLYNPFNFGNDVRVEKKLQFVPLGKDVYDAPFITAESSGDLLFNVYENIILGAPDGTVGKSISIPFGRKVSFNNSHIYADAQGGLVTDTSHLVYSDRTKVSWGSSAMFQTQNKGADLLIQGSIVSISPTTSLSIPNASPFEHGNIATMQPISNGAYSIGSTGDLFLTPGVNHDIVFPSFTLNKKVKFDTDVAGNMGLISQGDIYLSPKSTVMLNPGKSMAFGGNENMYMTVDGQSGNMVIHSVNALVLQATNGVFLPSNVPLMFGNKSTLWESDQGVTTLSSEGDISLVPGVDRSILIPANTKLLFGLNESISSDGEVLSIVASFQIVMNAPLGVNIPQNIPLFFGDNEHRMYQDNQNNIYLDSSHQIILKATERVTLDTNTLSLGGTLIYQDVDGALSLYSGQSSGYVKTVGSFYVESLDEANEAGSASLMVNGGAYISKNLIVNRETTLLNKLNINNTVFIDNAPVPILVTNASISDGTGIGFTSRWDFTGGYTIGRGTPDIGGGRSLMFSLPPYVSYGMGAGPNFFFGSANGDPYMILDDTGMNLSSGILYVSNETENALIVKGGANVGSIVVVDMLSAGNNSIYVTPMETTVNTQLHVHNALYGFFDNGNQYLFTMDETGNMFQFDTLFYGAVNIKSTAIVEGTLNVAGKTLLGNDLDLQSHRILNLSDPVSDFEPATKNYVDLFLRGLSAKEAVMAATTDEIDLTASHYNIDDVSLHPGDRILVKNQTTLVENGIYELDTNNVPFRANDVIDGIDVSGSSVFVSAGTVNGTTGFVVVGNPVIVGTNDLVWTPFSGASQINTGPGLTKDGNVFRVLVDDTTISIDPGTNVLQISPSFVSPLGLTGGSYGEPIATSEDQSHVTMLGTITSGTWNADVIPVAHGGTGVMGIPKGYLMIGNGDQPFTTTETIYIHPDTKNIGMNITAPQSNLHVVNAAGITSGTWLRLEDTAPLMNQGSGITINSTMYNAKISLRADGTLNIGQEDFTNASKISLSTQRVTRFQIDQNGNVVVGTNSAISGNILTIYGKFTSTGGANIRGDLTLPSMTIRSDPLGNTILDAQFVKISNGFDVASDVTMGNFKLISTLSGETNLISADRSTGLGLPMYLKTSPNNTSAVCISAGLLVPGKLQLGGVVGNTASGFSVYTVGDNLHFTPGVPGAGVLFNAPMSFGEGLSLYDKAKNNDFVTLNVSTTYFYLKTKTTTVSSPYDFVVGGGTNEIITTFTNKANSASVKYDPTNVSEYAGGVFSVSNNVLSTFGSEVRLMDILRFNLGNSTEGVLGNTGWYYLGILGTGRTTLTASLSWRLRIDYDGISRYAITILNYDRNVASLVIFQSTTGVYHLFLRVISGPCRVSVVESPNRLYLNRYEGGSVVPNGQYSGYLETWTLDLNSVESQSNATLDFGSINVLSSATLNNITSNGTTSINGSLAVNGSSNFVGDEISFSDPSTTLPKVTMGTDVDNVSNVITIHGGNTSSPALIFDRTLVSGSVGMIPSTSTMYADAMLISHNNNDPSSQILLSTRGAPALLVDSLGTTNVLSTLDSVETEAVSLNVKGGAIFDKRVLFRSAIYGTEFRVMHATTGDFIPIIADDDLTVNLGNSRISNLADPVNLGDAVNMRFVQGLIQGLSAKDSVTAASSNSDVDLTVPLTILDETVLSDGDRVLIKNQTNPVDNGIYVVQYGIPPRRAEDLDVGDHAAATFVFVSQGTTNANSGWICSTVPGQDVVGVNAINFTQFSGAGQFNAGAGLAKIGNTIVVLVDGSSLEIVNNNLRVKSSIAGDGLTGGSGDPLRVSSITHLDAVGTLKYGTWNANVISMAYGGTGRTNFGVGRIPFSNGLSLTQGALFFDDANVRLGINTTSPMSGLTLQDRDIQVAQSVANASYILLTSSLTNYTYAVRNEASKFIISSGAGTNKLALTDVFTLDNAGVLSVSNSVSTNAMLLSNSTRFTGNSIESTVSGAMAINVFSLDNTGAYFNIYGGMGTSASRANAEFLRFGYYNAQYILQTSANGLGTVRNLCLQAGTNTNQFVLQPNGNAVFNTSSLYINGTRDATSTSDGGSLTVLGGAAFGATVYAKSIYTTVTNDASITSAGGISGVKVIISGTYQNYSYSSNAEGRLILTGTRTSTASVLQLSSFDANNGSDVMFRTFGLGKDVSATSEWLQIGYESISAAYSLRTQQGGAASQRPLILSATSSVDQMTLNTDGSVMVFQNFMVGGNLTVSSTQDATAGSDFAAMTISGGLRVKKAIYVSTLLNVPTAQVSNYVEISASGSVDNSRISYTTNGQVNIFNNGNNTLNIHTHNSVGPTSVNQEKLVLGYGSSNSHVIQSVASGTGISKDLVLTTGTNVDQMRLTASDGSVRFSGILQILSTSDNSVAISGGMTVQKSIDVKGSMSIGSDVTGRLLTIRGMNTWALVSNDASNMYMQSITNDSIFSFADKSGVRLLSVDCMSKTIISRTNTVMSVSNVKACSIQNALGTDMFVFDTVNHLFDMNGGRITNVGYPQLATDGVSKMYVDNLIKGLKLKEAVRVASNTNIDLTKPVTIVDGVTVQETWRVLLMFQTNAVENGIYVVTSTGLLRRADDLSYGMRAAGVFCFVETGAFRGDKGYVCIADYPNDIVGTNAISFTQFNGNIISAGLGLYKDGNNVMNLDLETSGGLSFNGNHLRVDPSFAGTGLSLTNGVLSLSPITSVSTVISGKWQGSIVDVAYGGTGNNAFGDNQIVYSDGSKLVTSANLIWDHTKMALGINGEPDPHLMGDGLRTVSRDICVQGDTGGIYFADDNAIYNWGFRRSTALPNSPIKNIPPQPWRGVTMSKDGMVLIATSEPGFPDYISRNGGYNWEILLDDSIPHVWGECVMSYDGSVIIMCASEEYLFVSNDQGETFSRAVTDYPRIWEWCSISDNGQYVLASALADGMFASSDSGQTWALIPNIPTDPIDLGFVHVSKDGSVQFAGYFGGPLYESRDYGVTFTERTDVPHGNYYDIAESRDSNVLVMYEDAGSLFVSSDMGVTWTERLADSARRWVNVTISPDGSAIAAADNEGQIHYSSDFGNTWMTLFDGLSARWTFAQVSEDGTGVVAGGANVPIYMSTSSGTEYAAVTDTNLHVASGQMSPDGLFYYGDAGSNNDGGSLYRFLYSPSTNIIVSAGKDTSKGGLYDFVIFNDRQQVGIGYDSTNAGYISNTLDVNGTMYVDNTVQFKVPLGTSSGGTGSDNIPYGLVIANGIDPFTSTYGLPSGAVPIGSTDGTGKVTIERGDVLRRHLGLGIGLDVQAYNNNLDAISTLTPTQGYFIMGTGSTFVMGTAAAAANSMGLGRLAYLDNVNNDYFLGTPLSVENGGTGNDIFTPGIIPFYNGGNMSDTTLTFDYNNIGLAINGPEVPTGSGLSVHGGDVSLIPITGGTVPSGILFHNIDGGNLFRIYSKNDTTYGTGSGSLVISGGVPNLDKTSLVDRVSILSTGEVNVLSTVDSTSVGTGALRVMGGASFTKNIYTNGRIVINNTTEAAAGSNGALVVAGGIFASKGVMSSSLTVSGATTFTSAVDATSATAAGTVFTGGLGVTGKIYNKGGVVIERTASVVGARATGLTIAGDSVAWVSNTTFTDANRHLSLISNVSNSAVVLNMRNLTSTNGWDIITEGSGNNRLIFQSAGVSSLTGTTWMTVDATNGNLTLNSTQVGSLTTAGGISCAKNITCSGLTASFSTNGEQMLAVRNSNTGTSAYSIIRLGNNVGDSFIFLNSSTRTIDGGANAMTMRNDVGALRMQSKGGLGITISETTGDVTSDGKVTVMSTEDATSGTAAMMTSGGLLVRKSAYITNNLVVNGTVTVQGAVTNPTVTTTAGDLLNVSTLTVKSAKVVTTNQQNVMYITFKVTPTVASLNTQFTFNLPGRTTLLTEELDLDNGQCSGFTDTINHIVLENTLCTGVPNSTKAMVKFQSVNTTIHYLQVMVSYAAV